MTIRELGQQLRSGKLSCVDLIERTLEDIKKRDTFRSVITLLEEQAMAEARDRDIELAVGSDRGPLHGIPIGLKDLFYTRGIRTTGGSLVYKDFVPDQDATVVERLRRAGAIAIAKTNLHEIAFGITSKNPHFGYVLNPRDPARIAGGSSGGSATLVAGNFVPMALGTDTGGSIRVPATFCGITGLKPTYGCVSRHGVLPLAYSLDHVGPLGACVEDCALAMNAIAGFDEKDPTSAQRPETDFNLPALSDLRGVRVGLAKNFFFERLADDVAASIGGAIKNMERLGASLIEVDVPDMTRANVAARVVQLAETAAVYVNQVDASLFGEDVWSLLQQGRMILGYEYVNAQRIRTLFRRDFDVLWRNVDVLATPTTPITAPLLAEETVRVGALEEDRRMASTRLVRSANFLGEPALSMPCGNGANGMPVGLQLMSAPFSDPRLLQIAKSLEPAFSAR